MHSLRSWRVGLAQRERLLGRTIQSSPLPDFFIRPTEENAQRVIAVLDSFGFSPDASLKATLTTPGKVVQIGRPPNRIDLLTGISGVDFAEAIAESHQTDLDGIPIRIVGLQTLLNQLTKINRKRESPRS